MVKLLSRITQHKKESKSMQNCESISTFKDYEHIPMEIAIYNAKGEYLYMNCQYLPDPDEKAKLIGKTDKEYCTLKGISTECAMDRGLYFQEAITKRTTVQFTEKLNFINSGKILYFKRIFKPVISNDGKEVLYVQLFGSNLTAIILAQKELKYLAYFDKVTGLKNRDAFYQELDRIILESSRSDPQRMVAILFCGLDNFKMVNDSLGHAIGDLLLREVAERMNRMLRATDYMFRLGGDEFTVIIQNIKNEYDAGQVAEKLIQEFKNPFVIGAHEINYLSLSVGVVIFPRDGDNSEALVRNADAAMYNVKNKEKNDFQFFSEEMTQITNDRLKIVRNLKSVISKNDYDNQFKLFYQPIIEKMPEGGYRIAGSEALIRWSNPELGQVSPTHFIPIAEESNLINQFGHWILEKSIKDFLYISEKYKQDLYISVNLSAKQLRSPQLVITIDKLIKTTGIDPKYLQFEITETSYMDDDSNTIENIQELTRMGCHFAIDDFGVGFASLVYLQKIPAKSIKIDRSFINCIDQDSKNNELVKSIIQIGKNLNKDVIAEGVEDIGHLNFLEDNLCSKFQGYLFSKPVELNQFETYLVDHNVIMPDTKLPADA
ncbi:MAG: EAL domain-containing protein [Calditrichaceae bacterium]